MITTRPLNDTEYRKTLLCEEYLILLVSKDFPVNQRLQNQALTHKDLIGISSPNTPCVSLSESKELPFIVSNSGNYLRSCTDILFQEAQFEPDIVLKVEETAIGLNFAKYGVGAMICNHLLLERSHFEKHFFFYKLDSQYSKKVVNVLYRAGTYVTPAMSKFIELADTYSHLT